MDSALAMMEWCGVKNVGWPSRPSLVDAISDGRDAHPTILRRAGTPILRIVTLIGDLLVSTSK
jgi:hypothetical protein